jgi:Asp-tRNA(Asn)/Glu-tRNA(Gln) amidotransferase C subunit
MRELNEPEVRALAEASGISVPEEDLSQLTIRLNGMLRLLQSLEALPLSDIEPIPTLLTQREGYPCEKQNWYSQA